MDKIEKERKGDNWRLLKKSSLPITLHHVSAGSNKHTNYDCPTRVLKTDVRDAATMTVVWPQKEYMNRTNIEGFFFSGAFTVRKKNKTPISSSIFT